MKHTYTFPLLCTIASALSFTDLNAQVANDECAAAMQLTVSATCVPVDQDAAEATQSQAPVNCNPQFGTAAQANDMWYTFAGTGENVRIEAASMGDVDLVLEAFSGACGALTSLDCADATYTDFDTEELVLPTVLGTTYTFRVFPYLSSHSDFLFSVCVLEAGPASVGEVANASALNIYPNPSKGDLTVMVPHTSGPVQLAITDAFGRLVFNEQRMPGADGRIALPLTGKLAAGSYILRARSSAGDSSQPFIVD